MIYVRRINQPRVSQYDAHLPFHHGKFRHIGDSFYGDIAEGWRLCDGTSGAYDLAGRFPLGVDAGGLNDEDAIGDAGGHRWHGETENNHSEHPNHRHAYDTNSDKADAGQDGTQQTRDASPGSDSWTSGMDYLPGGSGDLTGHLGPYNSGEDTDNRPPYRVVAFIERFK